MERSNLNTLVLKSLDDVITKNKDQVSLSLVHAFDLSTCPITQRFDPIKGKVIEARILRIKTPAGEAFKIFGFKDKSPFSTSNIECISKTDTLTKVKTTNSTYEIELVEKDLDFYLLVHLCVMLNNTGVGEILGVPPFFY